MPTPTSSAPAATSIALALAAIVGAAQPARADVITLNPAKDNTLYEDPSGTVSNGAGSYFFSGKTGASSIRRGLVAFDLRPAIPPGSTVTAVSLRMTMSRTRVSNSATVGLHRVLADWGESFSDAGANEGGGATAVVNDATWIHRFYPITFWTAPGGDYFTTASATTTVSGIGTYTWSSATMVANVQAWANSPSTNFGWLVRGDESQSSTSKRFNARESGASSAPALTITFTPPPNTGACCMPNFTCRRLIEADCVAAGGSFQGVGTVCLPSSPCPPPTGACCFGNTTCQTLTQAACAAQGGTYRGDGVPCSQGLCPLVLAHFVDPLPIPAVMQPVSGTAGGEATYQATITEFQQQLHRDLPPTTVWGINGSFPGPTIEAGSNLPVTVTWANDLRDPSGALRTTHYLPVDLCLDGPAQNGPVPRTVIHLHGGRVPPEFDGYPEYTQAPGEATVYTYPNGQDPATLWYHDHSLGLTRLNVYMGVAGFYLIRDPVEQALGLPGGQYEVPLMICDRSLAADGHLMYHDEWHDHFFGETILVNGKAWPFFNVKRGKYRFRLLNASTSRTYELSLSNLAQFQMIGTEQGLLPAPITLSSLVLQPAERADIVIDFASYAAGTRITLTNTAPAPFPGEPDIGEVPDVMQFVVTTDAGFTAPLPADLRPVVPLDDARAARTRDLNLRELPDPECGGTGWFINGLSWHDVREYPRLGAIEVWRFINRSGVTHPMHMHLVRFQVLDRQPFTVVNDNPAPSGPRVPRPPEESGWKDTVQAHPGEITRVIARFEGFSGRFPYHCHILEHEDKEMMRQMEVLPACPGDFNDDGIINSDDFFGYVAVFFSTSPRADFNNDGLRTSQDFFDFLSAFFAGCP